MHLSERLLSRILAAPSNGDADETVKALAQEVRTQRVELRQLKQAFVPIYSNVDPRSRSFFLAFNDLCLAHKVRAAAVVPYTPAGSETLLLHIAGETNTATLVKGLLPKTEET